MTSFFNNSLLATSDLDIPLLIFAIVVVILAIFFLFLILTYVCRGIEFLIKPALSSKAGKIIFSPAVGVPLFVVLIFTIALIVFFTNQAEITTFFTDVFGK